jgi:hypothetical protein
LHFAFTKKKRKKRFLALCDTKRIFFLEYAEELLIIVLSRRMKEFYKGPTPGGSSASSNGKPWNKEETPA